MLTEAQRFKIFEEELMAKGWSIYNPAHRDRIQDHLRTAITGAQKTIAETTSDFPDFLRAGKDVQAHKNAKLALENMLAINTEIQDKWKAMASASLGNIFRDSAGAEIVKTHALRQEGLKINITSSPQSPDKFEVAIYKGQDLVRYQVCDLKQQPLTNIKFFDKEGHDYKIDLGRDEKGQLKFEAYAHRPDDIRAGKRDGYLKIDGYTFDNFAPKPVVPKGLDDETVHKHIRTFQSWARSDGIDVLDKKNDDGSDSHDGLFGVDTTWSWQRVVVEMQQALHLKDDGIMGDKTMTAIAKNREMLEKKIPANVLDAMLALQKDNKCCKDFELIAQPGKGAMEMIKGDIESNPILSDPEPAAAGGGGPKAAPKLLRPGA